MSIDPTLPPGKLTTQLIREQDPALVAPFVDHPNVRVRESAVGALIRTPSPHAERYLIAFIEHSNDRYLVPRVNAHLAKGASRAALPALAKLIHHPIEDIKASAINALRTNGSADLTDVYLDALSDRSWIAKWYAMHAIAEHGNGSAVEAVADRLRTALAKERKANVAGKTEVLYALEYLARFRSSNPTAAAAVDWARTTSWSRLQPVEREWFESDATHVTFADAE